MRIRPRSTPTLTLLVGLALATLSTGARGETLRIGTSGDYPPFSRGGEGFDVEVGRLLAQDLGVEIVWVPFTWPTLTEQLKRGDFDLAMGGVTWRAERAAVAPMTRAVAQGAPCIVGDLTPEQVAVNRGGILERFARARFPDVEIVTTEDNLELPELLSSGRVGAFVTDSFEVEHFARGRNASCEPPRDRKVYWLAPHRTDLGPRLDDWIGRREEALAALRLEHFGVESRRTAADHLVDLLARRFAFMPHVALYKRAHGLALTDLAQEERILDGASRAARERGLDVDATRALFETLIDLAKRVQERTPPGEARLDLREEIRPALVRLTPRLLDALVALRGTEPSTGDQLAPLSAWLHDAETDLLLERLSAFRSPAGDGR